MQPVAHAVLLGSKSSSVGQQIFFRWAAKIAPQGNRFSDAGPSFHP